VAVRSDIFYPKVDDIAAPELAVDCEIEYRKISLPPFDLQLRPN
jgi:hypothetical protein